MSSSLYVYQHEKGHTFVGGLYWQSLDNPVDGKKHAREIAKQLGFDHVVWRRGNIPQVGFAKKEEGAQPGMYSLAALIAKCIEMESGFQSFLCAVRLPDNQWLYVSQREGAILPEGDIVGPEDKIHSQLLNDASIGQVDCIYAPEEWGLEGVVERTFESFLPHNTRGKVKYHAWWKLVPISVSSVEILKRFGLPLGLLFGIAAVGLFGYQQYQASEQEKIAQQLAMERAAEMQRKGESLVPHPWASHPVAMDWTKACISNANKAPLYAGGWQLLEVTCTYSSGAGFTEMAWRRPPYASIETIKRQLPQANIGLDGDSARISMPIIAGKGTDEKVLEGSVALEAFQIKCQRLGLSFSITETPSMAPMVVPGASPESVPPPPDWKEYNWRLQTALSPAEIIKFIDSPGLRVKAVKLTVSDGLATWVLEGALYAKN